MLIQCKFQAHSRNAILIIENIFVTLSYFPLLLTTPQINCLKYFCASAASIPESGSGKKLETQNQIFILGYTLYWAHC